MRLWLFLIVAKVDLCNIYFYTSKILCYCKGFAKFAFLMLDVLDILQNYRLSLQIYFCLEFTIRSTYPLFTLRIL